MLIGIFLLANMTLATAVMMFVGSWKFMIGCLLGMVHCYGTLLVKFGERRAMEASVQTNSCRSV
jgi:hypothetical protein